MWLVPKTLHFCPIARWFPKVCVAYVSEFSYIAAGKDITNVISVRSASSNAENVKVNFIDITGDGKGRF